LEFWNESLLIGLAAVAIPIIIHLLSRRRAKVIDWGAMRFLLGSVAARSRRILIEQIILMILRCLIAALAALAVARPFIRQYSVVPWGLVLPTCLAAMVSLAIAGAVWHHAKARLYLLIAAGVLLLIAGGATAADYISHGKLLPSGSGGKDVAIIADASTSMYLRPQGSSESNFQTALGEAGQLIDSLGASDAVSLILAGPAPRELTSGPTSDKTHLRQLLQEAKPTGGPLRITRAMEAAASALREGRNSAKRIVLLTDGQALGWNAEAADAWRPLADALKKDHPKTPPEIVVRRLGLPSKVTNAAVEEITFSHKLIGIGRRVRINVSVRNFGTAPVPASSLELHVEGAEEPLVESVDEIMPGSSQSAGFDIRFEKPGPHIVAATFLASDDIPEDNTAVRVADVIEAVPVLIVDGAPSADLDDSASGFLTIALSLREDIFLRRARTGQPAPQPAKASALKSTIQPLVVLPEELEREKDLRAYRAVILANVARLPESSAKALAEYVSGGGGLLILAGERASAAFYNSWSDAAGKLVAPAKLPDARTATDKPVALSLKSFTQPGIRGLIDSGESDAGSVTVSAYWPLEKSSGQDETVRAALENGTTLIAEKQLGNGIVVMMPIGFNAHDSNLPGSNLFLPFAHELVYYCSGASADNSNVKPGTEVMLPQAKGLDKATAEQIKVVRIRRDRAGNEKPDETTLPVVIEADEKTGKVSKVSFARTAEPGLYRFVFPQQMAGLLAGTPAKDKGLPFTVEADASEGDLAALRAEDMKLLHGYFDEAGLSFSDVADPEATRRALAGAPNREIWKYLAVGLLVLLVGEIALARWITAERRAHLAEDVRFAAAPMETVAFRTAAAEATAARDKAKENENAVGAGTL